MDYDEMMIEIISRLPLKALDSIRATSKKLNSLTYDPYLFDLYKKRNNIVSGFLVQNKTNNGDHYINEFVPSPHSTTIDLKFLPRKTRIMATNEQGITVFEVPHPRRHRIVFYHVCKPTTKQVLALPNPKTRFETAMVAVVTIGSNPLHYKILRFSEPKKLSSERPPFTYNCEIFDSTAWAWKWLAPSMLPGDVILANKQPITTGGSIYMLLTNGDILKFDAYSEKQTTFSPPSGYHPDHTVTKLVKYEGKLGFAFQPPNDCWEIWVHSTNDESWEKMYVLNQNEDTKRGSLESLYDSDTCVIKDCDTLVFYKFRRDNDIAINKIKLRNIHNHQIFVLRSDIETTNLKGRVKPWIAEQWQCFLPRRVIKTFLKKLYKKIYKSLFKKVLFGLKNLFRTVTKKGIRREERRVTFIKLDQPVDVCDAYFGS